MAQLLSSITQTNIIAYPCIPCRSDGYIFAARMQKGDGLKAVKQKMKP
jgi:hypothetical protein